MIDFSKNSKIIFPQSLRSQCCEHREHCEHHVMYSPMWRIYIAMNLLSLSIFIRHRKHVTQWHKGILLNWCQNNYQSIYIRTLCIGGGGGDDNSGSGHHLAIPHRFCLINQRGGLKDCLKMLPDKDFFLIQKRKRKHMGEGGGLEMLMVVIMEDSQRRWTHESKVAGMAWLSCMA